MSQVRGSTQLRRYHQAREQGHGQAHAAFFADIHLSEAELIDKGTDKQRRATASN